MDERKQDSIDRYLLGQMTAEEAKAFEEQLAGDDNLREQFRYTKMVRESVCSHAQLQEQMDAWDKEIEEERCNEEENEAGASQLDDSKKKRKRAVYISLLLTSCVAAALAVGFFFTKPDPVSAPEFRYVSIMAEGIRDGSDLSQIDSLLLKKEYATALAQTEQAETQLKNNPPRRMFRGRNPHLDQEQYEYELREYRQRQADLLWLNANALLGLGRYDEALATLSILRDFSIDYKEKADSLYNLFNNENN